MTPSFLLPLFLAGLAGIAIPVFVHLTRKERKNLVAFPSLMFLEKIPFQERRRHRIQNWALLALRALALAMLALAFARPFFDAATSAGAANGGPREIVVVLDRSYSMGAGTQWEHAIREASAVFDRLGPLDRASLVTFSRSADVAVRSTNDPARLRAALDTVSTGWGVTRYGPALKVAQTILEESDLPGGEVVLVSDLQRNGWMDDQDVTLPSGSSVIPVSVRETIDDNIQVSNVTLARTAVAGRERVTASARITRRGGSERAPLPVTLEVDGQELQTRSVDLGPDDAALVTFTPFTLSQSHTRGAVRVPADALPADDARFFVLSPGRAIGVLIVEGSDAAPDASLYARRALETSEDGRFDVRVRRSDRVRTADLTGRDVVILNDIPVDGASAAVLSDWVERGGGLMVVLGERSSWPASSPLPLTIGPVQDRDAGRGDRLGFLDHDHPVFEPFSGPRSGDFSRARFLRTRGLQLPGSPNRSASRPTDRNESAYGDAARVLARYDDGSVALMETRTGRGAVVVWTSTLDAFWNDLALQPVFLPFIHRVTEYLSGRTEVVPWLTVGQVVDLSNPDALRTTGLVSPGEDEPGLAGPQVVLTPRGSTLTLPPSAAARFLPFDERGVYVLRPPGTDPPRPRAIAANVDVIESSRDPLDAEELVAQIVRPSAEPSEGTTASAPDLRREDLERRQSVWRYLMACAVGLLLFETVLSNWMSRRRQGIPGVARG